MDCSYECVSLECIAFMNELQDIHNLQLVYHSVCSCFLRECRSFHQVLRGLSGPKRKRTSALGFESWTKGKKSNSWHLLGSDCPPGTTNGVTRILSFEPPNPVGRVL